MSFRYRLVVLGNVRPGRVNEIKKKIAQLLEYFNLQIGQDIQWLVEPSSIDLRDPVSTAVVFLGGNNADQKHLPALLKNKIPILPVVSEPTQVSQEIPKVLRMLNCKKLDGTVTEIGADRSVYRIEVDGKTIVTQVTLGAPHSVTLYNVYKQSPESPIVVFYDAVGLHEQWVEHLKWINQEINYLILIEANDKNIQWCLSDWET